MTGALLVTGQGVASSAPPDRPAAATCDGRAATIEATEGEETVGTAGNDVIVGTEGDDVIDGLGGNDLICPGDGDDDVDGGDGTDTVVFDLDAAVDASLTTGQATGQGADSLTGVENLTGGPRNDVLTGAAGTNRLNGKGGTDTCDGKADSDAATDCEVGIVAVAAGSIDTYTQGVAVGENVVVLDSAGYSVAAGSINWLLTSSTRTLLSNTRADTDRLVSTSEQGPHTLSISGGTATDRGTLRFRMTVPPVLDRTITPTAGVLTSAPPITLPRNEPGQYHAIKFTVTQAQIDAGKVIAARLDEVSGISTTSNLFYLNSPTGSTITSGDLTTGTVLSTTTLTTAGTYTIIVNPDGNTQGTATLRVTLNPAAIARTTTPKPGVLTSAPPITLPRNEPGQYHAIRFTVTQAQIDAGKVIAARLDEVSGISTTSNLFYLNSPTGSTITSGDLTTGTVLSTTTLTTAGTYTIIVNPDGNTQGTAKLKVVLNPN